MNVTSDLSGFGRSVREMPCWSCGSVWDFLRGRCTHATDCPFAVPPGDAVVVKR